MQENSDSSAEEREEEVDLDEQGSDDVIGSGRGPEDGDSSSDLEDYGEQEDRPRTKSRSKKTEMFTI